jgi:hypothetical protein
MAGAVVSTPPLETRTAPTSARPGPFGRSTKVWVRVWVMVPFMNDTCVDT